MSNSYKPTSTIQPVEFSTFLNDSNQGRTIGLGGHKCLVTTQRLPLLTVRGCCSGELEQRVISTVTLQGRTFEVALVSDTNQDPLYYSCYLPYGFNPFKQVCPCCKQEILDTTTKTTY